MDEVSHAINSLKENKDPGPMGISVAFIKYNATHLIPILTHYLSNIMEYGIIPQDWKHSFIVPIPKKGNIHDVNNYRGIALQSVIPNFFDKLLTKKLRTHIAGLIPSNQHGFMESKSTTTNLLEFTQFIKEENSIGNQVDVIYFDLSKAFDRVNHKLLATKLARYSIPYSIYFTATNFIVGPLAHSFETHSSVPQGSHIGPLLFNIMTADMTECTINTNCHQLMFGVC